MFLVKQVNNNFLVKRRGFKTIEYNTLQKALELCRLRCHKILQNNDLKVIQIPFFKIWLVW
jgi:hypothetical protein